MCGRSAEQKPMTTTSGRNDYTHLLQPLHLRPRCVFGRSTMEHMKGEPMTALSAGAVLVALSAAAFLALGVPLSRGIATAHRTVRGRGPMNEPTAEPRTAAGRRLLWDGPSMDIRGAPTDLRQRRAPKLSPKCR